MKMRSLIILLPLFIIIFFSCKEKQFSKYDEVYLDSLADHCYDLVVQLQTDTLRMVAQDYMKATELYSYRFYKARQYYINSYFNAGDYDKVLSLLAATEQMPSFNEYPALVCDYMYTRARAFQYSKRYPEAIEAFKHCLRFTPEDKEQYESLLPTVLATMTQLLNTYVISGKVEEGYRYYTAMKVKPPPIIRRFALRDLYSHLGYIASQTNHLVEAYRITDSVFVLPLHNPTPEKFVRDYSYAAAVFYYNPDVRQRVITWLELTMEEADKCGNTGWMEWSMDMLGKLYWQQNKVEEGIELEYKALASAQKRGDKIAECQIYETLSRLYRGWELYKQANEFADHAIEVILTTDESRFKSLAFNAKAQVMQLMELPDSAIFYYKKAEVFAEKSKNPDAYLSAKGSIGSLLIDYHSGDSLVIGIQMIRDVLNTLHPDKERSFHFYTLGKGLIKQGRIREGEAMLDSMYAERLDLQDFKYTEGVLEYVIDHYLAKGDCDKVMQYTSIYRKQVGVLYDEKISRKITSAMVQFQTEKKEQQLKLVTAELAVKELRNHLYVVLVIILVLLLFGGILWYLYKRRLERNRQLLDEQEKLIALRECELMEVRLREQEKQLVDAIENLRTANHRSEQISEQLNDFLSNRENQQSIASLTPSIFREEGEVKFRRYFTQLYPSFLYKLKEQCPIVSRSEEILCMLIALNQNMDQISDILCIEKKSVKMARYRLRKKMQLEQEDSLDGLIKAIL